MHAIICVRILTFLAEVFVKENQNKRVNVENFLNVRNYTKMK